jgi:hypothetical protein
VFENRVLRRIFGRKTEKVAGGWRRQHNEELHNLYGSPHFIRVIKSRIIWAGHVARLGEVVNTYSILVGKLERKNHPEDLDVDGRIILEWALWK